MMKGLLKGLQMLADAASMRYRAQKTGNDECLAALDQLQSAWFRELTGVVIGSRGATVQTTAFALLMGADPFAGSREMWQGIKTRFQGV